MKAQPFAILFVLFLFSANSFGQVTGSGSLSGTFSNAEPVSPAPITLTDSLGDVSAVTSVDFLFPSFNGSFANGDGTSSYSWGLNTFFAAQYFVDGVEFTLEEFGAIGVPGPEFQDSVVERVFGISDNSLSFESEGFENQLMGETFVAGHLEYSNGESHPSSGVSSAILTLDSLSDDAGFTQTLELGISILSTENVIGEEVASADFIFFTDRPDLGSFRVFEGAATSVEILVEFNSLDLIGFGNVADPSVGFVSNSVSVPEPSGFILSAILFLWTVVRRPRRPIGYA